MARKPQYEITAVTSDGIIERHDFVIGNIGRYSVGDALRVATFDASPATTDYSIRIVDGKISTERRNRTKILMLGESTTYQTDESGELHPHTTESIILYPSIDDADRWAEEHGLK